MPAQAIEQGVAHHILPAEEMAAFINTLFAADKER